MPTGYGQDEPYVPLAEQLKARSEDERDAYIAALSDDELFAFTYGWYEKWLTYAILIGTAIFDGALYLWVGDAIVCYRCGAYHKGFKPGPNHHPFDITVGERYRQERLRKERVREELLKARRDG